MASVRTDVFEQLLMPQSGGLAADLSRFVLSLRFPEETQERFQELSEKAQLGTLSPEDEADLDAYLHANAFLIVLKSKARRSLQRDAGTP